MNDRHLVLKRMLRSLDIFAKVKSQISGLRIKKGILNANLPSAEGNPTGLTGFEIELVIPDWLCDDKF